MACVIEDCFDPFGMIENGIANFGIAQQLHQRNAIGARTAKGADDEIKIRRGEACPAICPNHRAFPSRALTMPQPISFEGGLFGASDLVKNDSHGEEKTSNTERRT